MLSQSLEFIKSVELTPQQESKKVKQQQNTVDTVKL